MRITLAAQGLIPCKGYGGIQRQVETLGDGEIPSARIGEMVMDGLRQLDSVAYIRFASVYRDFSEARDFEEFASAVRDIAPD